MNKKELVDYISRSADLTKIQAEKVLKGALGAIEETLKNGEKVSLAGFGIFSTSRRDARTGRNPQNGQTIKVPAKTFVRFKAGKKISEVINGG